MPLSFSREEEELSEPTSPGRTKSNRRPFKLAWMRKLIIPAVALLILLLVLRPQPLTYHVADIDPQFGVSEAEVESILQDAANRWNLALKKTAIRIDTGSAGYPINFVFDYRQEYQNSITSIDSQYSDLDSMKVAIDQQESSLESEKSRLDQESASLKTDIAYWNSRGGATGMTYGSLEARRKAYNTDVQAFNDRQAAVGQRVKTYNARVAEYNKSLNQAEQTFKLAGGSTTENAVGVYDVNDRSITIYAYSDFEDLRLIFMHELGHALGSGHASAPGSIMYPDLTHAQNLANPIPTIEDLALVGRN